MKAESKGVLHKLLARQVDPNSTAALEVAQEVAERVLRNLAPASEPLFPLTKSKSSEA